MLESIVEDCRSAALALTRELLARQACARLAADEGGSDEQMVAREAELLRSQPRLDIGPLRDSFGDAIQRFHLALLEEAQQELTAAGLLQSRLSPEPRRKK